MLKRKVDDLIREYEDAAQDFYPELVPDWTITDIVNFLNKSVHRKNFSLDFPSFCATFIANKEKTSHQAALNYSAAVKAMSEFMQKDKYDICMITSSRLRAFENHLKVKYGNNARAVSLYLGAIATMHKSARLKYNTEELDEVLIKNPFDYYTPPKQPISKHRAVDESIIQGMINNYHLLKGQERIAVGTFLLSFATMGMNTPDLYECEEKGNGILHYFRHKTRERRSDKAEMYVRIEPCIKTLFEEYHNKKKVPAFIFFRRYATYKNLQGAQKDGLKAYKERIGFNGPLTFYSARHSWATIARSNKCGIATSLIDECLDHVSNTPLVDIYAKKDFSIYWEANKKVLDLFNWTALNPKHQ